LSLPFIEDGNPFLSDEAVGFVPHIPTIRRAPLQKSSIFDTKEVAMETKFIDTLGLEIKTLVIQEVRLLRARQAYPSPFVIRDIRQSIEETKKKIVDLLRGIDPQKRNRLMKRIIDQTVNEEIDHAIEARKDRCLRCSQIRYFDETGTAHIDLPRGTRDVSKLTIGCEYPCAPEKSCTGFKERPDAVPIEEYVMEVTFFYEVKEMFGEVEKIWDYLNIKDA
jgi:hypothetical protein